MSSGAFWDWTTSSLMAGKSAGTSCDNAYPNEAELQAVEDNFRTKN